jgi:hypothetical protein
MYKDSFLKSINCFVSIPPNPAHRKDGLVLCLSQSQTLKHYLKIQFPFKCQDIQGEVPNNQPHIAAHDKLSAV